TWMFSGSRPLCTTMYNVILLRRPLIWSYCPPLRRSRSFTYLVSRPGTQSKLGSTSLAAVLNKRLYTSRSETNEEPNNSRERRPGDFLRSLRVQSALKKLYRLVHPDMFSAHPTQKVLE